MARLWHSTLALGLVITCAFPGSIALAGEAISYSYDTQGRLIKVSRSGTVNDGVQACYSYDKANNRANVTVAQFDCSSPPPSFSVNDVSVTEGGSLSFIVTRSGSSTASFSIAYATANGSAAAGSDYTASSGTLSFLTGETSKSVSVSTINDTAIEGNENLVLNLSAPSAGSTIGDGQGVGTIIDNDSAAPPPGISIGNAIGMEGMGATISFGVTFSAAYSSTVTVNYATADGTATAAGDYFASSGTLTFAPGETSKSITISLRNNLLMEGSESFYVNLSGATGGATITDAQGLGAIGDDDLGGGLPEPCFDQNGNRIPCPGDLE